MSRKINFFDGVTTGTPPVIGNLVASNLVKYADDAAYEAAEVGSPTEGNLYYNTTLNLIRYYNGTSWINITDESSAQTLTNKSIDGDNNTLTNVDGDEVVVDAISGLTAINAQAAFAEHQVEIEANTDAIADLETLSGSPGLTSHASFTGTTIPDASDTKESLQALETAVEARIPSSEKGANNGVATLDGSGKLPSSQLPISVAQFLGNWDANTNTPTLIDGTGTQGDTYRVSVAGSQDLGSGSLSYDIGDWVYYDGTIWQKGDNIDQVTSVNTQTGAVVLDTDDISEGSTNLYFNGKDTDDLTEGSTNLYYTEGRVTANTSVTANTAKVSADGSIDTHSDVDTSTVAPTDTQVLTWVNANSAWEPKDAAAGSPQVPTIQKFTSGSGTYTTPTSPSPLYIKVTMVGGGGGGQGSSNAYGGGGTAGTVGGTSTFGTSLLTAAGGAGGAYNTGGAGGASTVAGPAIGNGTAGSRGDVGAIANASGGNYYLGGSGGTSALGGGAANSTIGGAGYAAATNSGSGGGGGSAPATASRTAGSGGGSGGYISAIITSPGASYSYQVGGSGGGGAAGAGGLAGGAGGSGIIIVEEYY